MESIISLILINFLVYAISFYIYDKYEITAPLFMAFLIFCLSFCLGIMKLDTIYYENECMLCNEITYSKEEKEINICDDCKKIIKELKEREEK